MGKATFGCVDTDCRGRGFLKYQTGVHLEPKIGFGVTAGFPLIGGVEYGITAAPPLRESQT